MIWMEWKIDSDGGSDSESTKQMENVRGHDGEIFVIAPNLSPARAAGSPVSVKLADRGVTLVKR